MVLPYRHWNPLSATKDHVVPLSKGGEHSQSNIVAACLRCNGDKADLTLDEWCEP
ncbi:MAG: HNH endonuclease [Proteobacteria bacterium]|nr:HNH endonuclease [Pseudomonadota bacterium]